MRLFIGLELSPALRHALSALRGSIEHARWLPPETYHLTLRFLGEVREGHRIDDIDLALGALSGRGFPLRLAGAGAFANPSGGARLWVGCDRNDALGALQGRIDTAMRRNGFTPPKRKFIPHVTLATLASQDEARVGTWMGLYNLTRFDAMDVTHVTLFRSHLGPDHPVYEPLAHYPLDHAGVQPLDDATDWEAAFRDPDHHEGASWRAARP